MLARLGTVRALVLAMVVLPAPRTFAGPQDDPQPPVKVVAGDGRFLSDATVSLTLTLDDATRSGDLEPGQVEQARAAAAAAQGQTQADAGATSSTGERSDGSASAAGGNSGAAVVGECGFRAATVPAGDARWDGNDPTTGSLLVNTCNGPAQYLFVPNAAPGAPAVVAPPPPPPPPDPAVLAQQAYVELTLPDPVAKRSPDENNSDPQYGGLPYTWIQLWTYVWAGEWQSYARTVELRGVSATVTATPTALVFDPGDGAAAVTCDGQGRPWTPADGSDPPSRGGCGYMYRAVTPNGPLTATTSIRWSVAWTSNVGAGGTFPVLTTRSASSFLVEQIQVVIK